MTVDREELGVFLMESPDGSVAVQLFHDVGYGRELFENLKGKPTDNPFRASYIVVDWNGGVAMMDSRQLPDLSGLASESAYKLGVGPIEEPSKESEENQIIG